MIILSNPSVFAFAHMWPYLTFTLIGRHASALSLRIPSRSLLPSSYISSRAYIPLNFIIATTLLQAHIHSIVAIRVSQRTMRVSLANWRRIPDGFYLG